MAEIKKIFISYAHEDESFKDALVKHLSGISRNGLVQIWTDTTIQPGQEWDQEIRSALHAADIILFLVSADFMASNYIHNIEIAQAIERHNSGRVVIVPVIIRPCDFRSLPLKKFQALPKNSIAVTKWSDQDEAYLNIVQGIKMLITAEQSQQSNTVLTSQETPPEEQSFSISTDMIDQIRNNIAQNKTEVALTTILQLLTNENADSRNACIVLQSRFKELQKKDRLGLMAYDEYARSVSGINIALLEILDAITEA